MHSFRSSMKSFKLNKQSLALVFMLLLSTTANARPDIWHELLHFMQFADVNRATLEFHCNQHPSFLTVDRLRALCEKRHRIPDHVFEDAAIPYLKKHISEPMAKRAISQISTKAWQSVGRKLITEIATGKQDQLTTEDIAFLEKQNQSEVGRALSAFSTDKEQGIAVAKAMQEY